jgi:signal transduction histidine kinase
MSATAAEPPLRAPSTAPHEPPVRDLLSRFNVAFSLMSVIPLLTCLYLINVRFFSWSFLQGLNGVYFLLALVIALLGLLVGHQLIRDIIRQLAGANAKLALLNNQQAAFVSNVAHEFRAPLAVFKGALDNLADGLHGPLTPDQQEPVGMCQKEVNRLRRLVGDLLDLSRIEAGKLPMKRQDVVLQEVLQAASRLFNGVLKERGLRFELELPEAPARLVGDRDRLEQVFVNLLSNAIKFTEQGGIGMRLTRQGAAFRMEVSDTGPGIAPEDLERVFNKFERLGSPDEEGAGLGLPIARDIVELHHGHIWAESEPGSGSRFIVELPAA